MRTNNTGLVSIPPPIRSGPGDMMTYLNLIRKSLLELRDRIGGGGIPKARVARTSTHPFKLSVNDGSLRVGFGSISAQRLLDSHPIYQELPCYFNSVTPTYLVGDPWNPDETVGEFTLVNSTDYGVWLDIDRSSQEAEAGFGGDDYDGLATLPLGPTSQILVSSTHLGPGYWSGGGTIPTFSEDHLYRFVGKVSVDGDGNTEIIQHLRSDITLSALVYPYGINFPEEPPP